MAVNPPSDDLPLADVMRGANGLVSAGLIEDWAFTSTCHCRQRWEDKDHVRVEQLLAQADFDKTYLADVLQRYKLKLPTT